MTVHFPAPKDGQPAALNWLGGRGHDSLDSSPGDLSPLAFPDLQGRRRPGRDRRDAAQRRPARPPRPRSAVRRAARHRQDLTARIVAKAVNCLNLVDGEPDDTCEPCIAIRDGRALDVVELDAASNNRVDDMRELLPRVYTAPADLKQKVFIIDEVQRIKEGWDVLLKTLEEPPPDVLFIFCTTDPVGHSPSRRLAGSSASPSGHSPSDRSRASCAASRRPRAASITDDALELIAQRAAGGMRDAESMLDQVISSGVDKIDADTVRDLLGLAEMESVDRFIAALAGGDALDGIRLLDELERDGRDLVAFADQVVARLREQLVGALAGGPRSADRGPELPAPPVGWPASTSTAAPPAATDCNWSWRSSKAPTERTHRVANSRSRVQPAARARPQVRVRPKPAATMPEPTAGQAGARQRSTSAAQPAAGRRQPRQVGGTRQAGATGATGRHRMTRSPSSSMRGRQIVERIGRNPANRPLINACRPVEVRGATDRPRLSREPGVHARHRASESSGCSRRGSATFSAAPSRLRAWQPTSSW